MYPKKSEEMVFHYGLYTYTGWNLKEKKSAEINILFFGSWVANLGETKKKNEAFVRVLLLNWNCEK